MHQQNAPPRQDTLQSSLTSVYVQPPNASPTRARLRNSMLENVRTKDVISFLRVMLSKNFIIASNLDWTDSCNVIGYTFQNAQETSNKMVHMRKDHLVA